MAARNRAAAITGAPLHIVHINSVSLASTPQTLELLAEAVARCIDVTTEAYPGSAGMTRIESALIDQYEWVSGSVYGQMRWAATGERHTAESFRQYRRLGSTVVLHLNSPAMKAPTVSHPLVAIASDGRIEAGIGHPRQAGSFSPVLGH